MTIMQTSGDANARPASDAASAGSTGPRLIALDGLRGIAALVVVVFHYTIGYGTWSPEPGFFSATPLHLLWDGSAAVSLFFVLSGFVLSYGYLRTGSAQPLDVRGFYLSRALRLLMPYAVAFLVSAFCVHYLFVYRATDPVGQVGFFFVEWIEAAAMPVGELLMDGSLHRPAIDYNTVPQAWTLSVELYLSLLFPLLIALMRRAAWLFVAIVLSIPVYHWLHIHHPYPLMTTGIVHFMLGMLLARYRDRLAELAPMRAAWRRLLFFAFGVACLSVRHVVNMPLKIFHPYSMVPWDISAFGAFVVVWATLVAPSWQRLLSRPSIQWLGRISYSLYLIHMVALYLLVPWVLQALNALGLAGHAAWLAGFAAAVLISLALAAGFYRAVEHPFTLLARRVAKAGSRDRTAAIGAAA